MSDTTLHPPSRGGPIGAGGPGWAGRAEDWLDARGKGAWIAAMVLGFIFFWPVGLALLAYMIWSKRMFNSSCAHRRAHHHGGYGRSYRGPMSRQSSGNRAFDAYREETLRKLEEEQQSFEAFLERLREAKDKAEFDQFMDDRASKARESGSDQSGPQSGPQAGPQSGGDSSPRPEGPTAG
ncbi:MAG: DUF2852 domain-containing protein [Limimaricola sp.]|uniref:DUF2852 domain-containing protein n=1 Tax=Limimaricola sp. TaxID=2211665 RepID=UPI001D835D6A|nr:DUF2852 domain-containing protein [Limimaricola sp.]MBI1418348.1 DUF2852 domain-containing protein [Limimaricola sp.]